MEPQRRQIAGHARIEAALNDDAEVQLVLIHRDDRSEETARLVAAATAHGAEIWAGSSGDLLRMSRTDTAERVIAMLGPTPRVDLDGLLQRGGAIWMLDRATYPSNVGFAIRTAEVS